MNCGGRRKPEAYALVVRHACLYGDSTLAECLAGNQDPSPGMIGDMSCFLSDIDESRARWLQLPLQKRLWLMDVSPSDQRTFLHMCQCVY